jgi:hypothetical protein
MDMDRVTQKLIDDPKAAEQLKFADIYIDQYHRMGAKSFSLPTEHAHLKPIIERYADDLPKFVEFVKGVRDEVEPRSETYISLHELYRTLQVRLVQQIRRDRAARALAWLEKHYPKATMKQKADWLHKLEQRWGRERFAAMDAARSKGKRDRLTTEEREEVLDQFWREVDDDIKEGSLPPL